MSVAISKTILQAGLARTVKILDGLHFHLFEILHEASQSFQTDNNAL